MCLLTILCIVGKLSSVFGVQSPPALVLDETGALTLDVSEGNGTHIYEFGNVPAINMKPHGSKVATLDVTPLLDKPKGDRRTYRHTTLPNGLQVVSVRDPASSIAAFAMAVNAGSYDNPDDLLGLAHFCEHMLFLGTKHFPSADGFEEFIDDHSGANNAFTANEHTVYYASLSSRFLNEGLERFADFFVAPLFNRTYVDKEVHAIDSEHEKNIQDQSWRTSAIFKANSNPHSPASRFQTGSLLTLSTEPKATGIDPVSRLQDWFKDHYCPSRMRLAVFSPDQHDQQLGFVAKHFGRIPEGTEACLKTRRSWATPLQWPKDKIGQLLAVKSLRGFNELWIHFPFPDLQKYYKSRPGAYMDYVLTYGGEKSLSYLLKDKLGLVNSFSFSMDSDSAASDAYLVSSLTSRGREQYKLVLDAIFHYLSTLKLHGVNHRLNEALADINALEWDWNYQPGASDTVAGLAEELIAIPPQDLLMAGSRIDKPNTTLLAELMSGLDPYNMNVALIDPNAQTSLFPGHDVRVLQHYNASYTVSALSDTLPLGMWKSWLKHAGHGEDAIMLQSGMRVIRRASRYLLDSLRKAGIHISADDLPHPPRTIVGIPSSKTLTYEYTKAAATNKTVGPHNRLFGQAAEALSFAESHNASSALAPQLWFRPGWITDSPKVKFISKFAAPRPVDSWEDKVDDAMRMSIYAQLLGDEIGPKLHDLVMTGVSYSVALRPHEVEFSFHGFRPRIDELVERVLATFKSGVQVKGNIRYDSVIEAMNLSLRTFDSMPVHYALDDRQLLLLPGTSSREEQVAALGRMTPEAVVSAPAELAMNRPLQHFALAMGNLPRDQIQRNLASVERLAATWKGATASPKANEEVLPVTPVVKPGMPVELRRLNQRPGDGNDVLVVSLLIGPATLESRVLYSLLSSTLYSAVFSELRTSRQLGYVAEGGIGEVSNVQYASCIVQGERQRADDVEWACEYVFFELFPKMLQNMSEEEFAMRKKSMVMSLLNPPSTYTDEFDHFWAPIVMLGKCSTVGDEELAYLRSDAMSKQLLADAWNKIIFPQKGLRNKLVIKHFAKEVPPKPTLEQIRDKWKKEKLSEKATKMLEREQQATQLVRKADSMVRKQLRATGTYFSRERHCNRDRQTQPKEKFDASRTA